MDKLVNYGVGIEPPVPLSGDFAAGIDYHTAMNQVKRAEREFMELPAHVRARFKNDAGEFLDFFNDPKNLEEAESLGSLMLRKLKRSLRLMLLTVSTIELAWLLKRPRRGW